MPDQTVNWIDHFAGPRQYEVARQLGDFVIAKADGTPSYQLSVVVDDLDAGVTHIVRGDDLLDSTPRQMLIYRALKSGDSIPSYFHLPLVVGPDGLRLAKRHGDSRLSFYRSRGVPASRVLELLSKWCGIPTGFGKSAADLLDRFDPDRIPPGQIVHSRDDEAFLLK